jgi:carboxylesterase type B
MRVPPPRTPAAAALLLAATSAIIRPLTRTIAPLLPLPLSPPAFSFSFALAYAFASVVAVDAADVRVATPRGVYVGSNSDPRFNYHDDDNDDDDDLDGDGFAAVESFLGVKYASVPRRFGRSRPVGGARDCPSSSSSAFDDFEGDRGEDEDEDEDEDAGDDPLLGFEEDPSMPARFARGRSRQLGGSVIDATEFGPYCWQGTDVVAAGGRGEIEQSEECLHLNIWRASGTTSSSNLPVAVFLHGGGWSSMGSPDPPFWGHRVVSADPGVIFVSASYRLGAFGFLATDGSGSNGMNGIDDAINALRWLRCNAGYFGGDPDRIALIGQGAGAAIACCLSVSPRARGLFRRGIAQSGECAAGDDRPDSIGLVSGEEGYAIALELLGDLGAASFGELADRDLYPASAIAGALPAARPALDRRILPDFPS